MKHLYNIHHPNMSHVYTILKQAYTLMIQKKYRLCLFCDENYIENEQHILLHCNFYIHLRQKLLSMARAIQNNF